MNKLTIEKKYDKDRDYVRRIIFTRDENQKFIIHFEGNLDLYFTLENFGSNSSFIIGKDNYKVWSIFDTLYYNIINARVYEPVDVDTIFETKMNELGIDELDYHLYPDFYEKSIYEAQRIECLNYDLKNHEEYKALVKNGKIIWKSDDYPKEISPYFTIEPLENSYLISFGVPKIQSFLSLEEKMMIENFRNLGFINVRIRNSGSAYEPFNILFMKAFNSLMVEDVDNLYHQIHIEEYLIDRQLEKGYDLEKILRKK